MTKVTLKDIGKTVFLRPTPELTAELEEWHLRRCMDHENTVWVRVITAGDTLQIRRQCSTCGHFVGQARKHQPGDADLPLADMDASENYTRKIEAELDDIRQRHARLQYDRETSWHEEHRIYLLSEEWRAKRQLVLKRAGGICEGCGVAPAAEVHHLHYRNHKAEFLFELVAVCQSCHRRLHPDEVAAQESSFPLELEHPCNGCRFTAGSYREWECGRTDTEVSIAISEVGECGPRRLLFEPLK